MNKFTSGYTLIELMMGIAMIGVLISIGIPSFNNLINGNKHTSALDSFLGSLNTSRSEAVKRSRQVVACPSVDGESCDATKDWNIGWVVFVDDDLDTTRDSNEEILKSVPKLDDGFTLIGSADVDDFIRFKPDGFVLETGEITLCDPRGVDKAIAIIISVSGKTRVAQSKEDGSTLTCSLSP